MKKASPITQAQVTEIINKLPAGNLSAPDVKRILVENGYTESQYISIINDSRIGKLKYGVYYRKALQGATKAPETFIPPPTKRVELTEEACVSFLKDLGYQLFKRVEV